MMTSIVERKRPFNCTRLQLTTALPLCLLQISISRRFLQQFPLHRLGKLFSLLLFWELWFWWQTPPTIPSWRARKRQTKSSEHPKRMSTAHIAGRGTSSKVFLRSQIISMIACCCSWLFAWSWRAQKVTSIVPWEGLNPHLDSGRTLSAKKRRRLRRMLAVLRSRTRW